MIQCKKHDIKYDKFDRHGFALEGYCQVCDKKFDEYQNEIDADIVKVKTARIDNIINELDRSLVSENRIKNVIEMLEQLKKGN